MSRRPQRNDGPRGRRRPQGSGRPRGGQRHQGQRQQGKGAARNRVRPSDPRSVAYSVLRAVSERDAYANLLLPSTLRDARLDERDAALATELTYGTLRRSGLLDRIIGLAASRDVAAIDPEVLDVLRLGSYQLLYMRTAPHAAVNTSVDIAERQNLGKAKAFVNAVLRTVSATPTAEWEQRLREGESDPLAQMAVTTAHPLWIARAFAVALGSRADELPDLLAANDERPRVHLAARPGEMSREELALVVGGEEGTLSPYAVHLDSGDPGRLDPVTEGLAWVQDEGSQLVAQACATMPLDGPDTGRWLDLCAGPGGKAAMLGSLAAIEEARLDAVEVAPHRARLVEQAVDGLPVTVRVADGRDSGLEPGYDRILLDAPCTGLGALRRRPEARWRRQQSDVAGLATLQRELLDAALELLRPGGVVLYATCSPHVSETVTVVRAAERRRDVDAVDLTPVLPEVTDAGDGPWLQFWPHRHSTDAMFMAALRKR